MTATQEELRAQLTKMRKEIGDRDLVGALIERTPRSIQKYEAKGEHIPGWYRIVIEELHRRKKSGRPLSPA